MKLKEIALIVATAFVSTLLFYRQDWGLNVPLFALLIVGAQLLYKPDLRHNRSWLWASFAAIVSSLGYYFTNNSGAAVLFVFSVIFSSGLQMKDSLLFFLPAHAFLNFFLAPFVFVIENTSQWIQGESTKRFSLRMFIVPFVILSAFLLVYANANQELWHQLETVFFQLNIEFVLSFILGFVIVLPLIRGRIVGWLSGLENLLEKAIGFVSEPNPTEDIQKLSRLLKEALLVFGGLMVLLGYLIFLDVTTLFSGTTANTLSQDLHSSIYILIVSMFMAIAVILYYYSLPVVYHPSFKKITWTVNGWIALNILLCVVCLFKCNLYVQEFGLTYKRLGVYTYLIATAFALCITAYKTNASLNNWALIKINTWMIYTLLIAFVCVPWDIVITRYNLIYTKNPDIAYLHSLSTSAQLEYYFVRLEGNNSSERKKWLRHKLNASYLDSRLESLATHPLLSMTAEDLRVIDRYKQLEERLNTNF